MLLFPYREGYNMSTLNTILPTLLEEFQLQLNEDAQRVKRDYTLSYTSNLVQVAMGMRRVGKSYFLFQEIHKLLDQSIPLSRILYINFEDDRLLPMNKEQLAELLEAFYTLYPDNHDHCCYLFLDEIQNVEDWPIVVRRFLDSKKVKIILSGSSAKLLSKEIASSLRGRSLATEIWPYSFKEYMKAKHLPFPEKPLSKANLDKYSKILTEYLLTGGFPNVQDLSPADRRTTLQSYVDVVVYKDIIERYHISNITLIKYLVKTFLKNFASEYSPNKLYNDLKSQGFKVSKDTVYDYIGHIEDSFLAFTVSLYSESLRKTQVNPKKVYAIDPGLATAYTTSFSPNFGRLFENLFYIDLRRSGHSIHYYKTTDDYQIDFFTQDALGKPHLYQIVWDITDKDTLDREQRALKSAEIELGITGELIDPASYLLL